MKSLARSVPLGAVTIVLGIAAAVLASRFPNNHGTAVGPGAFPMLVGIGIALSGAFILIEDQVSRRKTARAEPDADADAEVPEAPGRAGFPIGLSAGIVAFCVVSLTISLTLSAAFAFTACGRLLGRFRWLWSIVSGLVGAAVVHLVFRVLLTVPLPADRIF